MEDNRTKEERYNEVYAAHKALDEKLQRLNEKPHLSDDEEMEIKQLKKKKLYVKDMMEAIRQEP